MRSALPATGVAGRANGPRCAAGALGALIPLAALGDPFYYRYEADLFPETDGWSRQFSDPTGGLVRELDDGWVRLDTRASPQIFDLYRRVVPALALEPGAELRLTWRMQTVETDVLGDTGDVFLAVTNAAGRYVYLSLGPDFVRADNVPGGGAEHSFDLAPGVPHVYELRSSDMQTFSLHVDGAAAFSGVFGTSPIEPTIVAFGDAVQGLTSLSAWDFVEIAVTPEPPTALGWLAALGCFKALRRAARCVVSLRCWRRRCRAPPPAPRPSPSAAAGVPCRSMPAIPWPAWTTSSTPSPAS